MCLYGVSVGSRRSLWVLMGLGVCMGVYGWSCGAVTPRRPPAVGGQGGEEADEQKQREGAEHSAPEDPEAQPRLRGAHQRIQTGGGRIWGKSEAKRS